MDETRESLQVLFEEQLCSLIGPLRVGRTTGAGRVHRTGGPERITRPAAN
jgi:hypothetical protein